MSLTLVLEHAPHPQDQTRRTLESGELTIGREDGCDWQIEDPEKYVSRQHCTVLAEGGRFTVTDTSSGGLFVDGADQPLGPGNSATLEPGMRLRLGDFVIRVEMTEAKRAEPELRKPGAFDFDFGDAPAYEPPPERPTDLPPRFRGAMETGAFAEREREEKPAQFQFDDPFSLEPSRRERRAPEDRPTPGGGGYFDTPEDNVPPRERQREPARERSAPTTDDPFALPPRRPPEVEPEPPARAVPSRRPAPPESRGDWPGPRSPEPQDRTSAMPGDAALREAFFRGLGIAPPEDCPDAAAEMEALGQRFRALTEGLMQLLRARAQEKQNVRVAQTVIGSSEVNPLKFLATPSEGVEALVHERGPGYLPPDAAIAASYRDLADHQMRTWLAVQAALRRMIDRFDPASIEAELAEAGLLETLLAGGRGAKLWQLYEDRYRDIAKAAEDRFLGEVGADFRTAYEEGRRR